MEDTYYSPNYTITYSSSDTNCDSYNVTLSCENEDSICKHEFHVSSVCRHFISVNVTVTIANGDSNFSFTSEAVKIGICKLNPHVSYITFYYMYSAYKLILNYQLLAADMVNKFIMVSFDQESSKINLDFINQPQDGQKFYIVRYGPISEGCKNFSIPELTGHLKNTRSVSPMLQLELQEVKSICFIVVANNGTKLNVSVEGTYESGILLIIIIIIALYRT